MQSFRRDRGRDIWCECFERFNLLRSSAVIQTQALYYFALVRVSFNLLRSSAVIQTEGVQAGLCLVCQVSISYGAVQSFRPRFWSDRLRVSAGFQSPTEQCSHSDTSTACAQVGTASSFNLLRSSAVIQTWRTRSTQPEIRQFQSPTEQCSHSDILGPHLLCVNMRGFNLLRSSAVIQTWRRQTQSWPARASFNLLRSNAVIQTAGNYRKRGGALLVSISYGAMQSFRRHYACSSSRRTRFQSPTEQCSHSDKSRDRRLTACFLFQSPTEQCSHSDVNRRIKTPPQNRVSISYGAMQSFRLKKKNGKEILKVFQSPTEQCSHSDLNVIEVWVRK